MKINYAAITNALAQRLQEHPSAAALRAKLQSGAASIIDASDLEKAPAGLVLAIRRGTPAGQGLEAIPYALFVYDDPEYGHSRIDGLAPLLRDCLPIGPESSAPALTAIGHAISYCTLEIGAQANDRGLGMRPYARYLLTIHAAARRT